MSFARGSAPLVGTQKRGLTCPVTSAERKVASVRVGTRGVASEVGDEVPEPRIGRCACVRSEKRTGVQYVAPSSSAPRVNETDADTECCCLCFAAWQVGCSLQCSASANGLYSAAASPAISRVPRRGKVVAWGSSGCRPPPRLSLMHAAHCVSWVSGARQMKRGID